MVSTRGQRASESGDEGGTNEAPPGSVRRSSRLAAKRASETPEPEGVHVRARSASVESNASVSKDLATPSKGRRPIALSASTEKKTPLRTPRGAKKAEQTPTKQTPTRRTRAQKALHVEATIAEEDEGGVEASNDLNKPQSSFTKSPQKQSSPVKSPEKKSPGQLVSPPKSISPSKSEEGNSTRRSSRLSESESVKIFSEKVSPTKPPTKSPEIRRASLNLFKVDSPKRKEAEKKVEDEDEDDIRELELRSRTIVSVSPRKSSDKGEVERGQGVDQSDEEGNDTDSVEPMDWSPIPTPASQRRRTKDSVQLAASTSAGPRLSISNDSPKNRRRTSSSQSSDFVQTRSSPKKSLTMADALSESFNTATPEKMNTMAFAYTDVRRDTLDIHGDSDNDSEGSAASLGSTENGSDTIILPLARTSPSSKKQSTPAASPTKSTSLIKPHDAFEKSPTTSIQQDNLAEKPKILCELPHTLKAFFKQKTRSADFLATLEVGYKVGELRTRPDSLPTKMIGAGDPEAMWAQLENRKKLIRKDLRRVVNTEEVLTDVEADSEDEESEADELDEFEGEDEFGDDYDFELSEQEKNWLKAGGIRAVGTASGDEDSDDDEDGRDLFDLTEQDAAKLEARLAKEEEKLERELRAAIGEEEEDERNDQSRDEHKKIAKKSRKSTVDDKFFSLNDMNSYLDRLEGGQEEEILAHDHGETVTSTSWKYSDFFDPVDAVEADSEAMKIKKKKLKKNKLEAEVSTEVVEEQPEEAAEKKKKKKLKKKKRATEEEKDTERKPQKTVHFDVLDEDEAMEEEEGDAPHEDDQPVLLGTIEQPAESESSLKRRIKQIKNTMRELEAQNLEPRSWELQGEVRAVEREENTLLETHVDFEQGTKIAPEVTEEYTEKLEALIKQRIRDKAFDDVERKVRVEERVEDYREKRVHEDELMKKSLAEVYEKEFAEKQGQTKEHEQDKNLLHEEIEAAQKELYARLDPLFHYSYTPPQVRPEVKIVSNMPALRKEEVGAVAETTELTLAPEETKKKLKGELKATQERSEEDKKRERRKKKKKQKAIALALGEKAFKNGESKTKKQKRKLETNGDTSVKKKKVTTTTSDFFAKLQSTVENEISEKSKKKKKKEKAVNGGAAVKL